MKSKLLTLSLVFSAFALTGAVCAKQAPSDVYTMSPQEALDYDVQQVFQAVDFEHRMHPDGDYSALHEQSDTFALARGENVGAAFSTPHGPVGSLHRFGLHVQVPREECEAFMHQVAPHFDEIWIASVTVDDFVAMDTVVAGTHVFPQGKDPWVPYDPRLSDDCSAHAYTGLILITH